MARVVRFVTTSDLAMPRGAEQVARGFYGRMLGMREVMKPAGERGVWFKGEGGELRLKVVEPMPANPPGGGPVRAELEVDDAETLRKALLAARYRAYDAPPVAGTRGFFALDPFGNKLELRQKLAGAKALNETHFGADYNPGFDTHGG
ncbi:MAG: VOC family protein [Thermoplasmatota archaeon]